MNSKDMLMINKISEKNANLYYENFQLNSLNKYVPQAELRKVKKGEAFFPGNDYFGFIASGRFQRTLINRNGVEKVIRVLSTGNLIGVITYFLNKIPLESYLALTDGEIYIFNQEFIEKILLKDDEVVHEIIQWLCLHSASMSVQVEESLDRNLRHKISKFLYNYISDFGSENADGTIEYTGNLSQKDIAIYLGLNRVCVNRECNALANEKIIENKEGYWKILNRKYFEDLL